MLHNVSVHFVSENLEQHVCRVNKTFWQHTLIITIQVLYKKSTHVHEDDLSGNIMCIECLVCKHINGSVLVIC